MRKGGENLKIKEYDKTAGFIALMMIWNDRLTAVLQDMSS
jgi:hypothetical protein